MYKLTITDNGVSDNFFETLKDLKDFVETLSVQERMDMIENQEYKHGEERLNEE